MAARVRVDLNQEQASTLTMWVGSGKTEQRLALRAKVILLASEGLSLHNIAGRIQLASATPSKLNEKARWYSPLASPSNQRLRGVWAMHTLPGKNGTTSARQ